jgi:hypothetical protein
MRDKAKRTYSGAGMQGHQGWMELQKYGTAHPDTLFTVKCISLVLNIQLQMVKLLPVRRQLIDKRGYYKKSDISAWLALDMAKPDSLIEKLRNEYAEITKRALANKRSRYHRARLSPAEAKAAKDATKINKLKPATIDEKRRDPDITKKLGLDTD